MDGSHFLLQVRGPGMCVIIHGDSIFIYSPEQELITFM